MGRPAHPAGAAEALLHVPPLRKSKLCTRNVPARAAIPARDACPRQAIRPHLRACGDTVLGRREFGGIKPKQIRDPAARARASGSKDRLAEWLWGDALPRNVAATLETYIS